MFLTLLLILLALLNQLLLYYKPSSRSETESLAQHQYIALEDCLYYNLSAIANSNFKKFGSLSALPPTQNPGEKITIDVLSTNMKSLYMVRNSSKEKVFNSFLFIKM